MTYLFVHLGTKDELTLLSACFRLIKQKQPDALIDLITTENLQAFSFHFLSLNKVFIFPTGVLKRWKFIRSLSSYTYFIDVQRDVFPSFRRFIKWINSDYKIGYNHPQKEKPFNCPLNKSKEVHLIDYYFKALKILEIDHQEKHPDFTRLPESATKVSQFYHQWIEDGSPTLLINLSLDEPAENWAYQNWELLFANHNVRPYELIVTYKEEDREFMETMLKKFPKITGFGISSISERIELMERSQAVISVNTLDGFIAGVTNTPTLLITEPIKNYTLMFPLSKDYYVVNGRERISTRADVSFDAVLQAFREMIGFR